jgi:membrane protein YqaA with SNARE-associated domain
MRRSRLPMIGANGQWQAGSGCRFGPACPRMAIGKFLRYVTMTAAMLWVWPGQFTP